TITQTWLNYLEAFQKMRNQHFYDAWGQIEQVELAIRALQRNYKDFYTDNDEFRLVYLEKHIKQLQDIYPYKIFFSPGFHILEQECSICGEKISIKNHCGHMTGKVYDGKLCHRKMIKTPILEVSVVTNPVQKYSVVF